MIVSKPHHISDMLGFVGVNADKVSQQSIRVKFIGLFCDIFTSKQAASDLFLLGRCNIRKVVGHGYQSKHMQRMGTFSRESLCRKCDLQEETVEQFFVCECLDQEKTNTSGSLKKGLIIIYQDNHVNKTLRSLEIIGLLGMSRDNISSESKISAQL